MKTLCNALIFLKSKMDNIMNSLIIATIQNW